MFPLRGASFACFRSLGKEISFFTLSYKVNLLIILPPIGVQVQSNGIFFISSIIFPVSMTVLSVSAGKVPM